LGRRATAKKNNLHLVGCIHNYIKKTHVLMNVKSANKTNRGFRTFILSCEKFPALHYILIYLLRFRRVTPAFGL